MAPPTYYVKTCDMIARLRPDLAAEARSFHTKSPGEFARFLDKHFPLPDGRWGLKPIDQVVELFRTHYDGRA